VLDALFGLTVRACVRVWMCRAPYEGNQHGRAPEALNTFSLHNRDPSDTRFALMDLRKQGSFEAGILLHVIATHEDFFPDYPIGCGDAGSIAYDVMTAIDWSFVPASYPAGVRDLLAGLLTCDASARWSIRAAINSLRELVIAEGMVCVCVCLCVCVCVCACVCGVPQFAAPVADCHPAASLARYPASTASPDSGGSFGTYVLLR
jgi:hypothetical protein